MSQDIGAAARAAVDRLQRMTNQREGATATVPPYPVHVWPPAIANYVMEGAAAIDAPVDMAAVPLAAILGGVIGNRRPIALKRNYVVRPSLWTAVLADPTTGKSPMLGLAIALVEGLQADAVARFELDTADFDASPGAGKGTFSGPTTRPVLEHFFTNSCTMEWIAPAARDSAGIAAVRDELLGWFRDLDAYRNGKGGDRQTWLSLWSGGPLKVDRKGSGTIFAQHPVVSLCGGIQPGRFHELARDAAADAFLARFLLSAPDTRIPGWSEETVADETFMAARNLVAQLRLPGFRDPLPLCPDARALFREWHEDNNAEIAEAPSLMRDVYGKLPAQIGKIAGILQACHDPSAKDRVLPVERVHGAIDVIEYHRAHAQRAYALLGIDVTSQTDPRARRVTRILRNTDGLATDGWVARTTILDRLRNVPAEHLTISLALMEQAGTIERRMIPGLKKPTEQWRLVERTHPFGDSGYSGFFSPDRDNTDKPEHTEARNGQVEEFAGAEYEEVLI